MDAPAHSGPESAPAPDLQNNSGPHGIAQFKVGTVPDGKCFKSNQVGYFRIILSSQIQPLLADSA